MDFKRQRDRSAVARDSAHAESPRVWPVRARRQHMDFLDSPSEGSLPRRGAGLARSERADERGTRRGLDEIEASKLWQKAQVRCRLGLHPLAGGIRRPWR